MATVTVASKKDQFLKIKPNTSVTIRVLPDRIDQSTGEELPSIVSGFEYFAYERDEKGNRKTLDNGKLAVKPIRVPYNPKDVIYKGCPTLKQMIENDCKMQEDDPNTPELPKIFNAYLVWNYDMQRFQCFMPTQKSIVNELAEFEDSEKYGELHRYDIEIDKKGTTKNDTKYKLIAEKPEKATPLPAEILEAWNNLSADECDLRKLFKGEYPMVF